MRHLRLLALSVLVLLVAVSGRVVERAIGADEVQNLGVAPSKPQRPISLRDRLVVGLKARLKSEIAFVEAVVAKVQTGQIPQRQVDETFFWARQRAEVTRGRRPLRPIIYFQPAMRARAKLLRVSL